MVFLFTLLAALTFLGMLGADEVSAERNADLFPWEPVAKLKRQSNGDDDRVQNDGLDIQRRDDEEIEEGYVLMCTRDTRKNCVKVRLDTIGKR